MEVCQTRHFLVAKLSLQRRKTVVGYMHKIKHGKSEDRKNVPISGTERLHCLSEGRLW